MNSFKLNDHQLEFVFENCETIFIDDSAIKFMYFTTKGESFSWYAREHEMLKSIEIEEFEITLDITDKKCFHHPYSTMLTWGGTDSIITDGQKCLERLKICNDITHLYINGTCYHMPWYYGKTEDKDLKLPIYSNNWQENSEVTNSNGEHTLNIKIKPKDNTIKVR